MGFEGGVASKDFRAFRRGRHGDGSRRFKFDRATGQNETLKPIESRLRRTLKGGNPFHAAGRKAEGRAEGEKEDFGENQGILGDSDESVKGTDTVNKGTDTVNSVNSLIPTPLIPVVVANV